MVINTVNSRTFNFHGFYDFEVSAPESILERISKNMECEIENFASNSPEKCKIQINLSQTPAQIRRNKEFPFATIIDESNIVSSKLKYLRYDVHVRTIRRNNDGSYFVNTNIPLDENAGLLCMRDYICRHPTTKNLPLVLSSFVSLNNKGILVSGSSRQGKTTMSVYLSQMLGANFINDEYTLLNIQKDSVNGLYVPRTATVRFPAILASNLSKLLGDISSTGAMPIIDMEAIDEMSKSGKYDPRYGLAFSRANFCQTLGVSSQSSSKLDFIICPKYSENEFFVKELSKDEGLARLSKERMVKSLPTDPYEFTKKEINFDVNFPNNITFLEISYSGFNMLKQRGFSL